MSHLDRMRTYVCNDYPGYVRRKARELRSRGLTIDEIAARLAVSRTTAYYWTCGVSIPRTRRQTRAQQRASRATQARYAEQRTRSYDRGLREFPLLAANGTFRDFVCMYIGEGYKRSRNRVALGNSDPRVVRLADHWMRRLATNPLTYSLQFHADQDLICLRRYWALELAVSPDVIRMQRKSNSGQLEGRTWRSKHGVVTVTANDTDLRARMQAWMDCVQGQWLDSIHGV